MERRVYLVVLNFGKGFQDYENRNKKQHKSYIRWIVRGLLNHGGQAV